MGEVARGTGTSTAGAADEGSRKPISNVHWYESVQALIERQRPAYPVFCVRPHVIAENASRFRRAFPGRVLYSMPCNPHPLVVSAVHDGGIRDFDAASLPDIVQVRRAFSDAGAYFMHAVKDREAIRAAYENFGVRHFVVDCAAELAKLLEEVPAPGLFIFVRIDVAPDLGSRAMPAAFGAEPVEAANLVREAAREGCRVGLTFQTRTDHSSPEAYLAALACVGAVIERSRLAPVAIDVGGGFPASCLRPGSPQPLEDYVSAIEKGVRDLNLRSAVELWAEPGRALVTSGCSVLTRVGLRKRHRLFLNDGIHGSLSPLSGSSGSRENPVGVPLRWYSARSEPAQPERTFALHGPTREDDDVIAEAAVLPDNVSEGDWIEIGEAGAHSKALATPFNGLGADTFAEVEDAPPGSPGSSSSVELARE